MRQRGGRARRLATGLHHDDRLGEGRRTQRAHEAPRVMDALHVDQDALGGGIVGQEVQHLRQIDGGVGAQRDDGGEAHRIARGPVQDGCGQRTRLAHQPERPRRRQPAGDTGVELEQRALEAQRVRPEQVHAMPARDVMQLAAQRARQAGGQHQRRPAADASCNFHCCGDALMRQRDDGQIGTRVRQIRQRAGHLDVEKVQRAAETARAQLRQHRARQRRRLFEVIGMAREDDDRLRGEQGGQEVVVHRTACVVGGNAQHTAGTCRERCRGAEICAGTRPPMQFGIRPRSCPQAGLWTTSCRQRHEKGGRSPLVVVAVAVTAADRRSARHRQSDAQRTTAICSRLPPL